MDELFLYLRLGFKHIIDLGGVDHILFVLALTLRYVWTDWKKILILVTAFTIGHSLTLALSTLSLIDIPVNWIEFLIPVTILITAVSNFWVHDLDAYQLQPFVSQYVDPQSVQVNQVLRQRYDQNKQGKDLIDRTLAQLEVMVEETKALLLDTRNNADFSKGFIPQSINIGIDGDFAPWVGALIKDIQQPILLVTPQGKEADTIIRLSRVGFDNVLGYLDGSFASWQKSEKEIDTLSSVSVEVLEQKINENALVFDVRKPGEFASEHIKIAESTPLDFLNKHISEFPKKEEFYVHCAGGYRSVIAASILKARGINNVIDIAGGYGAIKNTNLKRTDFACPSKAMKA